MRHYRLINQQPNYAAANSKISSQTTVLPIQKSAATNCIAADSEIDSDGGVISVYIFFRGVFTKTESRREEKLLNPFLKLLKTVSYEPEPFSTCSCDFGTKRKKKTLSKWPRILTPAAEEI
jgi:hypothetical protein